MSEIENVMENDDSSILNVNISSGSEIDIDNDFEVILITQIELSQF